MEIGSNAYATIDHSPQGSKEFSRLYMFESFLLIEPLNKEYQKLFSKD